MGRAVVLIVDDDEDMLAVLATWCAKEGYDVVRARDGFEALGQLRGNVVDLVVTDLAMPQMSGLKLLDMLKTYDETIGVIILTGQGSIETAIEALREGKAFDYLRKPLPDLGVLSAALDRALDRRRQILAARAQEAKASATKPPLTGFTEREFEVARALTEGLRPEEICDRMSVSQGTLKNYLSAIYQKLGVKGRADAVVALLRYRLDRPPA